MKDNPFAWVHSQFAYLFSMILISIMYATKSDATFSSYGEVVIALNGLFWAKRWFDRKVDADKKIKNGKPREEK
jgi:hypothetical protein